VELKNEWSYTSASAVCLHGVDRDFTEVCEGFIFVTLCLDYISLLVYIRPRLQILLEYKLISKDGNCSYSKLSNLVSTGVLYFFALEYLHSNAPYEI